MDAPNCISGVGETSAQVAKTTVLRVVIVWYTLGKSKDICFGGRPAYLDIALVVFKMSPWCPNADSRTIKRSHNSAILSVIAFRDRTTGTFPIQRRSLRIEEDISTQAAVSTGADPIQLILNMPSTAGSRMFDNHLSSFMSVYGTTIENGGMSLPPKLSGSYAGEDEERALGDEDKDSEHTQIHLHQHHESTSTQTSDSTDSSPTTTISTIDSSSLSDPSPSSSPESPITLIPLSSFPSTTFGLDPFRGLNMLDTSSARLATSGERPMTSPSPRKFKNPKSLALNLNSNADAFSSFESTPPSFFKPPALTGRRKPSLLSLNTGIANTLSMSPESLASPMIPTMLQRRGLKHSMSSPQILATPSFGPSGGMTFGERKPTIGLSRLKDSGMKTFTIDEDAPASPAVSQMATRVPGVSVGGDSFDRPHSGEDAKSPSYPEGPILMHEPSVHLYLEPKLEEALEFDVIINVAREVKNPFLTKKDCANLDDSVVSVLEIPASKLELRDTPPDTACSMMSFKTACEFQPCGSSESSPTTPRPSVEQRTPEYIHVPWDHNTDVKDELWGLCETIDARTKEGKKVLVHCQQGASRSATLIIAYHMYKNQELGPNEAYSLAQAKSRWVNPNMSLLFSLNDFKKVIDQKKAEKDKAIRKPVVKHRSTMSADPIDLPSFPSRARGNSTPGSSARDARPAIPKEELPQIPAELSERSHSRFDFGETLPSIPIEPSKPKAGGVDFPVSGSKEGPVAHEQSEPRLGGFDFGGSLPSIPIESRRTGLHLESVKPADRPMPIEPSEPRHGGFDFGFSALTGSNDRKSEGASGGLLMSPRLSEMTDNPIQSLSQSFSRPFGAPEEVQDVPPTPALFSPRPMDFPRTSFFQPVAPQVVVAVGEDDPRSPPTKGETPIIRSIDDFL